MIPFFVADRPMSLRLLKGLPLQGGESKIGIMAHANTTENFQKTLKEYPCDNFDFCDAVGGPCQFKDNTKKCPTRDEILRRTIKMCDSGIFTKEGATLTYKQLFDTYVNMGVEYGIMIDVFGDPQATLKSAREALEIYSTYKNSFKLIGVAHGKSAEDYLCAYRDLRDLGFEHIAIGGLLRRVDNSARFTQVRDESFMYEVLELIREEFPNDWLFALGSFHPSRFPELERLNVWGDYKGWIFQYEKKDDTLNRLLSRLENNHLAHIDAEQKRLAKTRLDRLIRATQVRNKSLALVEERREDLFSGRRKTRKLMNEVHAALNEQNETLAAQLDPIRSHALLDDTGLNIIQEAVNHLTGKEKTKAKKLLLQLKSNRQYKERLLVLEKRINSINMIIAQLANQIRRALPDKRVKLARACKDVYKLVSQTNEREHRFDQVRNNIKAQVLDLLS